MNIHRQIGITLIEVLISVLILAIGLLGIAGLQTSALTNNFISYQYSQAAFLAQGMAERMRANNLGVVGGSYTLLAGTRPTVGTDCSTATCTTASQAQWDVGVWYSQVTGKAVTNAPNLTTQDSSGASIGALPKGATSISCPTASVGSICAITVYWDPGRAADATNYSCDGSSAALTCFRLAFRP